MTLADERLKELDNPSPTTDEHTLLRCRVAADLIHAWQHEKAREALSELWRGVCERPNAEGPADRTAAEVLLQAGVLSGWLVKVKGAQEAPKDLISESAALFENPDESDLLYKLGRYEDAHEDLARAQAVLTACRMLAGLDKGRLTCS